MKVKKISNAAKAARFCLNHKRISGILIGAGAFVTDQLFKSSIEMQPEEVFPHDVIGEDVEFEKKYNDGLVMGAMRDNRKIVNMAPAAAAATSILYTATRDSDDTAGIIGGSLVVGGALSNIYDRKRLGHVVDYIHVKKGPLSRIVFNLADLFIALGAVISLFGIKPRGK
ncbi:MAG: signal peptidase II [Lachnospiraceae bacterium]|nr:signal peptidase II [Lachnospiraceae bacterium]